MPLPAPYAPPWQRLGEDLVATVAWLWLKARELWRRNSEGSLPVPRVWPRQWPQLFWPLAAAAALLIVLALSRPWLLRSTANRAATPPAREAPSVLGREETGSQTSLAREPEGSPQAADPQSAPGPPQRQPDTPPARRSPLAGDREALGAELEREPPTSGEREQLASGPEDTSQEPSDSGLAPEPWPVDRQASSSEGERLRAQWSADDPDQLIGAITPEPATATLTLELHEPFLALPLAKRQQWADRWLERAAELGYTHLELRQGAQRLIGREAQVGSGMILLQPSAGPGDRAVNGEPGAS